MLKVVGASWEQTRLTSIILIVVVITALLTILFFDVPSKNDDGMYSATAYYSHKMGFNVQFWGQNNDPNKISKGTARAYYQPTMHKTGWASIEIETQASYPDWAQAFAAGLLEGSLSWHLIYSRWMNIIGTKCQYNEKVCESIRADLRDIETNTRKKAKEGDATDNFWHQVNLYYSQLDGLEEGWKLGVSRSRKRKQLNILHEDFLWMNSVNDIRLLEAKHNHEQEMRDRNPYISLAFLKLLSNSSQQFMLAHESGGEYSEMLRMQKKYTFGFHYTGSDKSELIPGRTIIFTSYPGAIFSLDDFYQVSGGSSLTITGTAIRMKNHNMLQNVDLNKVLIGPRVMAACRLSKEGKDWLEHMNREYSGTGSKQWLIVDTKGPLSLWVVEQGPNISVGSEQNDVLEDQGYWLSIGIPYFQETMKILGYDNITNTRLGDALEILKTGHENVTNPDEFSELMHHPKLIAIGRPDIIDYNSDRRRMFEPASGGVIDLKIAIGNDDYLATAGPLHSSDVPPFRWSSSILQFLPHYGQPEVWNFEPVHPSWVWES